MNEHPIANPGLTRLARSLEVTFFSILLLYLGKPLLVPMFFGLLVALLLYRPCQWLESRYWPRGIAVAFLMALVILLFLGIIVLLGAEINILIKYIPKVSLRLTALADQLQNWLEFQYNMPRNTSGNWLDNSISGAGSHLSTFLGNLFSATVSTVIMLVMIPIYGSLFLYHRRTFVKSLKAAMPEQTRAFIEPVLRQSIVTYYKYVKGNFFVYCIVGILNSIGLILLDIEHPVLYGMLTSFMMVIPYFGIFISASIPVSIALITKDASWYPLAVVGVFGFIQYLESNVIFPRVVGEQLNLSTWSTLVSMIAATILWGISGMILITPFLGIFKIVSEKVPAWQPITNLLGREYGYKGRSRKVALHKL
jgi:predicted PurR-regulated permease PerM